MDIKDIIFRISKFDSKQKMHILNILNDNNIEFTKNTNGYFFNFINIDINVIKKINSCLELIEANTNLLKEMDKRRNDLLNYYKKLIEERLNSSFKKKSNEYIDKLKLYKYSNINLHIKKVLVKRKCNYKDNYIDPDILIKDYLKNRFKYNKNSVYSRIITQIRIMKYNRSFEKKETLDNITEYDNDNVEVDDIDIDDVDIDVNVDDDVNIDDIDVDIDVDIDDPDIDNNLDDPDIDNNLDDEISCEIDETIKDTEIEDDNSEDSIDITTEDNKKSEHEKREIEISFYKKLLNENGYVFDENKRCLLHIEEYII